MRRPCYVVDAFTADALAGNAAGVVLDGAGLDGAAMQRIAGELKHSETAFPLPAREPTAALHLRWFSPASEVAFCGHATLAAFHVLVEEAHRIRVPEGGTTRAAFTCKSGRLDVELSRASGKLRIRIETPPGRFEPAQVPGELVTALGIVPEALEPALPPHKGATLEASLYLGVRDRAALGRCKPDASALEAFGAQLGVAGFVVYTLDAKPGTDGAMRCFFPDGGIVEDPVTGSAAGQLGVLMQLLRPGTLPRKLVFTQGDEMGRPGRVDVEVRPELRAWIGGNAVTVVRGELEL